MDLESFKKIINEIDELSYEQELKKIILNKLSEIDICKPTGQVESKHLSLKGFQCQWRNPNKEREKIEKLIQLIFELTGWPKPRLPKSFNMINGKRSKIYLGPLKLNYQNLENFLEKMNVFSYVFPYHDSINYTSNLK